MDSANFCDMSATFIHCRDNITLDLLPGVCTCMLFYYANNKTIFLTADKFISV